MNGVPDAVRRIARAVSLLVLDVDGVLTDGHLYYGVDGELMKAFSTKDGLGIRLIAGEGIDVAVISGRRGRVLERRLADLHVEHAYLCRDDKAAALHELLSATGTLPEHVAFMGDDLLDLPPMRLVGLPISVADGHSMVRREAAWVTSAPGGRGAVREVCDGLLEARGVLRAACDRLLSNPPPTTK